MATEIALKIAPAVDGQASDLLHDHTSGSEDEQESENEEKHEKLLKEITSLSSSSKRRQKTLPQRSEPNKTVSEFHLSAVKDSSQQVELSDLIGSLNKSNEHGNLKKKLDSMQRNSGTLDVPLTKPEAEKIQRTIAYGETKRDIEKWALTVKKNREAEHLSFPLKPFEPPRPSLRGLAVNFKPRTPLEEEVAAVLRGSSHVLERSNKELTEEEEKALLAMDLEEAKERRHELQKLRALQSYYEAKCRRMKKIKSKKYHRVKRKAEMRAAAKIAAEGDPQNEDDTETLEKADRLRAMERVSLKHRNTSKWAKHLMAKGSKNAEAKKLLQEQLRISRNLTEKTVAESESEDDMEMLVPETEADVDDDGYGNLVTSEDNPWKLDTTGAPHLVEMTSSLDNDSSIKLHRLQPIRTEDADEKNDDSEPGEDEGNSEEEFELKPVSPSDTGKKKPKKKDTIEGGKKKKKKRRSEITLTESEVAAKKSKKSEKSSGKKSANSAPEHGITGDSTEGQEINLLKTKKGKKDKEKLTDKSTANSNFEEVDSVSLTDSRTVTETEDTAWTYPAVKSNGFETEVAKPKDIRVDPKKIFTIEEHEAGAEDDESDPLHQKRIDIQQAFANDDVVEEFLQEKSEIEEASKPKDIDLSLPGWGTWAGAGINPSEKKKKQFTKKAKRGPPRKDKELSHVIINEEKSKLFAKNQVSEVPHPYGNHVQFERSVRNPVGKHWNTGTTVNQLTKPRVSTLIGTIIEPIEATKEIKRSKPEDRKKKKKKGQESSGIKIFS